MKKLLFSILATTALVVGCAQEKVPAPAELQSINIFPTSVGAINMKFPELGGEFDKDKLYDIFEVTCSPSSFNPLDAIFTSSNPEIIDINQMGRFKIVGQGKAIVTATLQNKAATCEFNVIADTVSSPAAYAGANDAIMIYFNRPTLPELLVDQARMVPEVTVIPYTIDKSRIEYRTISPSVARIEPGGQLLGVMEGTTLLKASIAVWHDKQFRNNYIEAFATVNVKKY